MRILYIAAKSQDYLNDQVFHGLRTLFGAEVVEVPRLGYMYRSHFPSGYPWFSFYGLLDDDSSVDRTDLPAKIAARYFDLVIYGSASRNREYLPLVLSCYPPNRIVYLDGEDADGTCALRHIEPQNIMPWEPSNFVIPPTPLYFKRELEDRDRAIALPICFSIPTEKIIPDDAIPPKVRLMSEMSPTDGSTHVYGLDAQEAYYHQYGESLFARTCKKGGWDCARHYEIVAAGTLPYFEGIEACPEGTLALWNKNLLVEAIRLRDDTASTALRDAGLYMELLYRLRTALRGRLTTEAMAKYVLAKAVAA
jgi:hypothetical protein